MVSSHKTDSVEAKYDVVLNFPNLELHSAAADGNVGLVHYALTHGQPINSVLHGVQPIHAAAAGGSISAMRMLIERGADVNAPRLPRRYSNEKKRGAPALGAAGATPLHFAAANGHVNIVQMLLTCGAAPNKSDKLGQTPESLAEHNGHEEVVHVLRIFEQLNANGAGAGAAGGTTSASPWSSPAPEAGPSSQSATSPSGSAVDLPSTSTTEAQSVNGNGGSRKGKERALSFVSAKSDSSAAVKVKKSLEGIWRKTSRSASMASASASASASRPPEEPLPIGEEEEHSRSNTPLPPSSPLADSTTPHSINLASPLLAASPILSSPQLSQNALDRVISGTSLTSNGDLQRVSSAASGGSAHSSTVVSPASPSTAPQTTVRERHPSTSSRRPSLPSILEKAAHPGAAFRAAMRRDHEGDHAQAVRFSPETSPVAEEAPRLGGRFRGRLRSNESGSASAFSSTSSGGSAIHSAQAAAKRYISKHNLSSLFKRSNSPPSRSPSPPKRSELTPINVDEMDEGIERLKRASQDVDAPRARSRASSFNEGDDAGGLPMSPIPTPKSAPATKTRFFEDLGVTPPQVTSHSASSSPRLDTPQAQAAAPERTLGRPRTSSGVIAPSPLANEWARDSDSDGSSPRHGIRRARTEFLNKTYSGVPPSSLTQQYHVGPGGQGGKQRSNTLPSGAYPPDLPASFQRVAGANTSAIAGSGLGWQEGTADLRKVATAGQLRESERARAEALEDEDDEVFHDALISVGEPMSREEVPLRQPNSEVGLPPVDQLLLDSEQEGNGDGDETTPTGENDEPHYDTHDLSVRVQGRFRGASIGSGTTESSRLATPPGSTVRAASFTSEEGGSERYDSSALGVIGSRRLRVEGKGTMSPPTPSSPMLPMLVTTLDTRPSRPRGISTSSTSPTTASASGSGSASGLALSFLQSQSQSQSQLTPSTSLTPGSAPASTPGLGFPPVPEHEVASSSPSPSRPSPPVTGRKISSRAEAADLVRQNEDDVLQLAQLPPSLDSSRSLAAQLAAYGESHAIEQEFAKQERKQRRAARRRNSGATADDSSDAASFVSARSVPSGFSGVSPGASGASGASSGSRRSSEHRLVSSRPILDPSTVLVRTDAPRSNSISINSIYDKRAAAYRERMAALTSVPPLLPPPRIRSRERSSSTRQRAVSDISPGESWLTAGLYHAHYSEPGVDARSLLSGPISVRSAETGPSASGKRKPRSATGPTHSNGTTPRGESSLMDRVMSNSSTAPSSLTSASLALSQSQSLSFSHSLTPRASAPAPIADVVSTRYAGLGIGTNGNGLAMPPPPTHPSRRPPRDRGPSTSLSASRPASSDVTSLIPGHPNPLLPAKSPASYSVSASPAGDHYLPTSRPLTLSQAQAAGVGGTGTGSALGSSPYVSIFSTRYSGGPHDGDESDDEETGARDYTVIENDWRGGHVVGPEPFRRGRWDSLKGAINHLGRR